MSRITELESKERTPEEEQEYISLLCGLELDSGLLCTVLPLCACPKCNYPVQSFSTSLAEVLKCTYCGAVFKYNLVKWDYEPTLRTGSYLVNVFPEVFGMYITTDYDFIVSLFNGRVIFQREWCELSNMYILEREWQ